MQRQEYIFIAASWKERQRVRNLAIELRRRKYWVYDFTDPNCRVTPEIPPEQFPEQFDPARHTYGDYINRPEWEKAIAENFREIDACDVLLLLLPCGFDATADWAYAVGRGKVTYLIGSPRAGERVPTHTKATRWFPTEADALEFLGAPVRSVK